MICIYRKSSDGWEEEEKKTESDSHLVWWSNSVRFGVNSRLHPRNVQSAPSKRLSDGHRTWWTRFIKYHFSSFVFSNDFGPSFRVRKKFIRPINQGPNMVIYGAIIRFSSDYLSTYLWQLLSLSLLFSFSWASIFQPQIRLSAAAHTKHSMGRPSSTASNKIYERQPKRPIEIQCNHPSSHVFLIISLFGPSIEEKSNKIIDMANNFFYYSGPARLD